MAIFINQDAQTENVSMYDTSHIDRTLLTWHTTSISVMKKTCIY